MSVERMCVRPRDGWRTAVRFDLANADEVIHGINRHYTAEVVGDYLIIDHGLSTRWAVADGEWILYAYDGTLVNVASTESIAMDYEVIAMEPDNDEVPF